MVYHRIKHLLLISCSGETIQLVSGSMNVMFSIFTDPGKWPVNRSSGFSLGGSPANSSAPTSSAYSNIQALTISVSKIGQISQTSPLLINQRISVFKFYTDLCHS